MADGTLAGSVHDIRNNQPIEGATIDAKQEGGSGDHSTKSGGDGNWSMTVPAGTYDLTVTATGYEEGIYPGIVVLENVTTTLNFVLHSSDYFG